MTQHTDIALFPLGLFLLPGEQVELHIFEPRYKQLLRETERLNTPFGIPYAHAGKQRVGSLVNLVKVKKRYSSGELDIIVEATRVFRINSFQKRLDHKLYPGGNITYIDLDEDAPASPELLDEFRQYITLTANVEPEDFDAFSLTLMDLAIALTLSSDQKERYATLPSAKAKETFLVQVMRYNTLLQRQEQKTEFGLYLN